MKKRVALPTPFATGQVTVMKHSSMDKRASC